MVNSNKTSGESQRLTWTIPSHMANQQNHSTLCWITRHIYPQINLLADSLNIISPKKLKCWEKRNYSYRICHSFTQIGHIFTQYQQPKSLILDQQPTQSTQLLVSSMEMNTHLFPNSHLVHLPHATTLLTMLNFYPKKNLQRSRNRSYLDEIGELGVPIDDQPVHLRASKKPNQETPTQNQERDRKQLWSTHLTSYSTLCFSESSSGT